jgi:hypothetical protein
MNCTAMTTRGLIAEARLLYAAIHDVDTLLVKPAVAPKHGKLPGVDMLP